MDITFNGKVAIVTGAGTGIGEAIAHRLASSGAKVVCCGLPDDPVEDVARSIQKRGYEAIAFLGNIGKSSVANACVNAAIDTYGQLDILINNAAVFLANDDTHEVELIAMEETINNNIYSVLYMTHFALPYLKKTRGVIVSTGSEAGIKGEPGNSVYSGSKGFVHAFTRTVALEYAKDGIRANCVCPGPIDTAMTHKEGGPMTKEDEKEMKDINPLGRLGTAEEVANVFTFLASDRASYVTGALWSVDGGDLISSGTPGEEVRAGLRRAPKGDLKDVLKHTRDGNLAHRTMSKFQ